MSPIIIAVVVGFITFLSFAVIGIILGRREQRVDDRLERYAGTSSQSAEDVF